MATDYTTYGVLAGNQVIANSGTTTILGNLGSILSIGGTGTVNVSGQTNIGSSINDALSNAQNDYDIFIGFSPNTTSSASDIGGITITPGFTQFTDSSLTLGANSGDNFVTLDGNGVYLIQIPNGGLTTVTTLDSVFINLINGAKSSHIFWIINGSLILSSTGNNVTSFNGTVICQGDITLGTGSTAVGSLCAPSGGGDITLNNNKITSTDVNRPRDTSEDIFINIESTIPDPEAITINASNVNGGINIKAGLGGINIETTGLIDIDGVIGMNIGSGSTGPINIGIAGPNVITTGNGSTGTRVFNRFGSGGNIKHQESEVSLSDADATLTIAQLLIALFTITPTVTPKTLTLPTAANAVAGITGIAVNDNIDFSILNLGVSPIVIVAAGTGGTLVGNSNIVATTSSVFRLRFTNVSSGTEAYSLYRIA